MSSRNIRKILITVAVILIIIIIEFSILHFNKNKILLKNINNVEVWNEKNDHINIIDNNEVGVLDEKESQESLIEEQINIEDEDRNGGSVLITSTEFFYSDGYKNENYFPMEIKIPSIDVHEKVYEGTDFQTLKNGPGHIIETPLPGQEGRFTVSGHRTTYTMPFNRVDEMEEGDLIYVKTPNGYEYVYSVKEQVIVNPKDVYIIVGTDKKELLLTACHPKYSALKRLIIISELINIYKMK